MTTFDDRERGFEAKFASDEDLKFRIMARRDHMLGEWAGEKFGLSGAELEAYARSILKDELSHPGDEAVVSHLLSDSHARGVAITAEELRGKLNELETRAETAVRSGL